MFGLKRRVNRGAQLLDEKSPGWYKDVNLTTLRMERPRYCVLGQLYKSYGSGMDALFPVFEEYDDEFHYGFNVDSRFMLVYNHLTKHWKKAIRERRIESESVHKFVNQR